jgi:hypothetical protein
LSAHNPFRSSFNMITVIIGSDKLNQRPDTKNMLKASGT